MHCACQVSFLNFQLILLHDHGIGSPCLYCEHCSGLELHFWRYGTCYSFVSINFRVSVAQVTTFFQVREVFELVILLDPTLFLLVALQEGDRMQT